jgi:hypothetical protein
MGTRKTTATHSAENLFVQISVPQYQMRNDQHDGEKKIDGSNPSAERDMTALHRYSPRGDSRDGKRNLSHQERRPHV